MTPEAIIHLSKVDKVLKKTIQEIGPLNFSPEKRQNPYAALIRSIAYQQLTGKAAATIFGRFRKLYSSRSFPLPEEIIKTPLEKMRSAGLSRAKSLAIQDIAQKTLDGVVPSFHAIQKMSDEEIIQRLTTIRGVGPWTVEMLLIFRLQRQDILPITDYGIRKGFSLVYKHSELPKPKELLAFGERWRPFRTTASLYLWRAIDLHKEKKNA